jgi:hypothetical protein
MQPFARSDGSGLIDDAFPDHAQLFLQLATQTLVDAAERFHELGESFDLDVVACH